VVKGVREKFEMKKGKKMERRRVEGRLETDSS